MLTIRPEQLAVLDAMAASAAKQRLLDHVREHFAEGCANIGEGMVRDLVDHGIARAAAHQLATEREVALYLNLMFIFGRDFDQNRELAWTDILRDTAFAPAERIEAAYAGALEYLEALARGTAR